MSDSARNDAKKTAEPTKAVPTKSERPKANRPWVVIGMVVSLLLSSTLLIWAFSLPFRRLTASAQTVTTAEDIVVTANQRRSEAQEIREAAITQHRDFLHLMKKQKQVRLVQKLPGRKESQERWKHRTGIMKGKIAELDLAIEELDVPEGSMLWENREQLVKIAKDSGSSD